MAKGFVRKIIKAFFVFANVITALCFFLGCYAKWFSADNWWFIGLFTLSSFYLFILLLLFFIGWILVKSRWAVFFILIIILTWKPILNIVPLRLPSSFSMQKQPNALRIMSWNVESFEILKYYTHPEEKTKMIELINKYHPDIACFQEMTCADSSQSALYHLQDFIDSLHFPYHCYSYDASDDYYPATNTHYGTIIFSRIPLINKQIVKSYPHDYNSTFQYVDIVNNNDTIRIFNFHLQSMKLHDDDLNYIDSISLRDKRDIKESKNIISKIKASFPKRQKEAERVKTEVNKSPYPVILCGDFNDVPNSYAYSTIGEGLQNAFVKRGAGLGRTYSEILPSLRIDNIFVDDRFSVLQYVRIKKRLSDHYPIITDIVFGH
jgi:endonuclease/exonuclease/phosphatase family metal-dependent hydrolase